MYKRVLGGKHMTFRVNNTCYRPKTQPLIPCKERKTQILLESKNERVPKLMIVS